MAKEKKHYAWIIMATMILMKIGAGAANAAFGNFVTPIVQEFNWPVNKFTIVTSLNAVGMALFYTTAAKSLSGKKIGLVMGIAATIEAIAICLMSVYKNITMFYISGTIMGIAQAFTGFVATPIVINMWFKKKSGTVLGTVMAVNSAAGVIFGLLSARLIETFGWRVSYVVIGAFTFLFEAIPAFLLIKTPEEAKTLPYGIEEERKNKNKSSTSSYGMTKKEAFESVATYLAWMVCLCYSLGSGVPGYISTFVTLELNQSITYGALAGTFYSLGCIICSILIGKINDKYGVKAGMIWGAGMTGVGYIIMFLSFTNPIYTYPAAFIIGIGGGSMYSVQAPLLARSVVGDKDYNDIWSIMMIGNSLIGGGLYSSWALFYDYLGSFKGAFICNVTLFAIAYLIGSKTFKMIHKEKNSKMV